MRSGANSASGLTLFAIGVLAALGCSDPTTAATNDASQSQSDAGIDRADATVSDTSPGDESSDDGSDGTATEDAGSEDRSSRDQVSEARPTEASTPSDARDGDTDPSDADAADDAPFARDTGVDGGCKCTPDDAAQIGNMSLECLCRNGACPPYDVAINRCPSTPFPEDHRIDTHADCNLVVIHIANSIGIGGSRYVYDATTRELLGASGAADAPTLCGGAQVFGYRAGTFPPPTCPRTDSAPRCVDGGDGG